jgi:cysteine-S-conjugate beta-lyase
MSTKKDSTIVLHSGSKKKHNFGAVTTPIFQSSAYMYPYNEEPLKYPRYGNLPNQDEVVEKIALLERAEEAVLFSTGMGAISTFFLTVAKPGDHLIVQDQIYGGTTGFLEGLLKDLKIEVTYHDFCLEPDFSSVIKPNTKALYIESPSNPLLKIVDIPKIAKLAKEKGILTAIDNTFATPINQKPITLGIDVVIHSATKYLNGHSDLMAGIVAGNAELMKKVRRNARDLGCTTNDLTAFFLSRGLKTLSIRVERHNSNAQKLAEFLSSHKKVTIVNYPGLKSHPQHDLASTFMSGFGGMLSFELDMEAQELNERLGKLKYFTRAVSLGGVESLLCLPSETSHSYLSKSDREKLGIKDSLIRVSVGIEDSDDLIQDWDNALK